MAVTALVEARKQAGVSILTLNDPPQRNALSLEMRQELYDRLREATTDEGCRAIVLTGAGGHFCAGSNVKQMNIASIPAGRSRLQFMHQIMGYLFSGPKPVIAAVEGAAAGAGMSFAAASDYAVAANNAKFAASFLRVGLVPDMGALWTVPRRIGLARARRFFVLGEVLTGEEAARLGLVDEAVAPGTALEAALRVADELQAIPPQTFALYKNALANRATTLEETMNAEVDYQAVLMQTRDHKEAVAAFLEKRKPSFTGQ
jgi:enoyl-CoA hydratase/carnithine racemase